MHHVAPQVALSVSKLSLAELIIFQNIVSLGTR